jgi:hypothetical protein
MIKIIICYFILLQSVYGISDSAYFKISDKIYFKSEVLLILNKVKIVECVFGETSQVEYLKYLGLSKKEVLIFRMKLVAYINEIKYGIDTQKINNILEPRLKNCHTDIVVSKSNTFLRQLVEAEFYFQEYLLGANDKKAKVLSSGRLKKLLDKRFAHFSYGD